MFERRRSLSRLARRDNRADDDAPPVTPIIEKQSDNIFRKRGDVWELRFNGKKAFSLSNADKGCGYIHDLLTRPNQDAPVWEIVANDESNLLKAALGQIGDAKIDPVGLESYNKRLSEAKAELEKAQKNDDDAACDRLTEEIEAILQEVNRVTHKGKIIDVNEEKRKHYNAFLRAVKRAIKKIGETDPALAGHLTKAIQFGNHPVYQPAEPIQWETDHVVNS